MTDVLILGDTVRCPELRHEIPIHIGDPFVYAEVGGRRVAVVWSVEGDRIAVVDPSIEIIPVETFPSDELIRAGVDLYDIKPAITVQIVESLGIRSASVPEAFPLRSADALRSAGVELVPDQRFFDDRRRRKTEAELDGIRRATRAGEAGMASIADLLARSERADGGRVVDGEPLTCELLRATAMRRLRRARLPRRRPDRRARPAGGGRAPHGLRPRRERRPPRLRPLPVRRRERVLLRHDADVRGRHDRPGDRRPGTSTRSRRSSSPAGSFAPGVNGVEVNLARLRLLRGARVSDEPDEARGDGAQGRLQPQPRARRRPRCARGAVPRRSRARARRRRRCHARARPVPARLRRRAARGHRARDRGRVRDADRTTRTGSSRAQPWPDRAG